MTTTREQGRDTPSNASSSVSQRVEKALSTRVSLMLGLLIVLWVVPRAWYAYDIDARNLGRIFNEWEESDNRFFNDWANRIADGDILGRAPFHPVHEWHTRISKDYLANHPEIASAIADDPPGEFGDAAVHRSLWDRWYGGNQFHQEPLYPYLLAALRGIFGDVYVGAYIFQSLLGLLNGALIVLLTRRTFGMTVAVVAGVFYAWCGFIMFHEQTLLRTTATCSATLLLVYQGLSLVDAPSTKRWLIFGFTTGLAVLLQSIFLAFFIGFVAIRLLRHSKSRDGTIKGSAVAALVMIVTMSPAFARNIAVGAPIFSLSSVGSVTFIVTNHPTYDEVAGWKAHVATGPLIALSESRPVMAALKTLQEHEGPASWIGMVWRKLKGALYGIEWFGNENYYGMYELVPSLRLWRLDMFVLLPLAVVGLIACARRIEGSWVYGLGIGLHMGVLLGLYVVGRFRVPMAVLLIPFAAWTTWALLRAILDGGAFPWILVAGAAISATAFDGLSDMRRIDQTRPLEFQIDFNKNYGEIMDPLIRAKNYAACVPIFERFFETGPDWTRTPVDIRLVSPGIKSVAKFYADRRNSFGDLLALVGQPVEAAKQKSIARQLQKIADVK